MGRLHPHALTPQLEPWDSPVPGLQCPQRGPPHSPRAPQARSPPPFPCGPLLPEVPAHLQALWTCPDTSSQSWACFTHLSEGEGDQGALCEVALTLIRGPLRDTCRQGHQELCPTQRAQQGTGATGGSQRPVSSPSASPAARPVPCSEPGSSQIWLQVCSPQAGPRSPGWGPTRRQRAWASWGWERHSHCPGPAQ